MISGLVHLLERIMYIYSLRVLESGAVVDFMSSISSLSTALPFFYCSRVRENCQYDDEDYCYTTAGMNYCIDEDDEFDVQEYLECRQYDENLYIGPYCSTNDAFSVYLGVFTDEYCTVQTDDSAFYDLEGYVLPYSATAEYSIIEDECANCREHGAEQDQADGDQADEDDVLEQCEELYEASNKCEEDLDISNPDTSACGYIGELYDEEDALKSTGPRARTWGIVIAVVIAALACCLCGFWAYQRQNKNEVETTGPNKASLI
jgi:hypothetical protein